MHFQRPWHDKYQGLECVHFLYIFLYILRIHLYIAQKNMNLQSSSPWSPACLLFVASYLSWKFMRTIKFIVGRLDRQNQQQTPGESTTQLDGKLPLVRIFPWSTSVQTRSALINAIVRIKHSQFMRIRKKLYVPRPLFRRAYSLSSFNFVFLHSFIFFCYVFLKDKTSQRFIHVFTILRFYIIHVYYAVM